MTTLTHNIDPQLCDLLNQQLLPTLALEPNPFWQDLDSLLNDFSPFNRQLLNQQAPTSMQHINTVLSGDTATTPNPAIDSEIANTTGTQLMVSLNNPRFALKATNARWGSLFDALYSGDTIAQTEGLKICNTLNQARANRVIDVAKTFLDETFPLNQGSHRDVTSYLVYYQHLLAMFPDGSTQGLKNPAQFVALCGHKESPTDIVLKNKGLHVVLEINRYGKVGCRDLAGINDIQVEAALTTVMEMSTQTDFTAEKLDIYRNWMGLMQGDLQVAFDKNGQHIERHLLADKHFTCKDGNDYPLPGRTLLIARNAGLSGTTNLIKDAQGLPIPEGILDSLMTAMIGKLDQGKNSRTGHIYIVKPAASNGKLLDLSEVDFTLKLFSAIETLLQLQPNTLQLGLPQSVAITVPQGEQRIFLTGSECTPTPSAAVLRALHCHESQNLTAAA